MAGEQEVKLDLRDVLVASAVTGNNALLSGSTGEGKTHLSKMIMAGLFGNKYRVLQMDASFSLDKLRDMTYDVIANGGRLQDAVTATDLLTTPGVVIDEYNRAPNEITNIIQGWLQNGTITFEGGCEVHPGVTFNDGKERYQWKIATVNEGGKYAGARKLDKASRDRFAVEIPLDLFPPTDDDNRRLEEKTGTSVDAYDGDGLLDDVLTVMQGVRSIPISEDAGEFLLYLQRMNQCTKAPNKTKLEIENFGPEYCKGCRLSRDKDNICGSIYAPSRRSRIALQNLAKGFALARAVKAGTEPAAAELEDVVAAAPFVLYSKLDIQPGWMEKVGGGSRWQAVTNVMKYSAERFGRFVQVNFEYLGSKTKESDEALRKYAQEQDAWAYQL